MNIVLSFVGPLQEYVVHCIQQIRVYTDKPIYLIYSDLNSEFIEKIKLMNVTLIEYLSINSFNISTRVRKRFIRVPKLKGREDLFFRSFERFYLLHNLIISKKLEKVIFLEVDNLIYDDPENWLKILEKKDIAFMIDNGNRVSTGLCFINNEKSIKKLIDFFENDYFLPKNLSKIKIVNEMSAIAAFYNKNKDISYILPSLCDDTEDRAHPDMFLNYNEWESLFDPSSYGVYLLGSEKLHTGGVVKLYTKNIFGYITPKNVEWRIKDKLKKPYIVKGDKLVLINNLHVHSKLLKNGLSIDANEIDKYIMDDTTNCVCMKSI